FVRDRRKWVRLVARRLGRVAAAAPMHVVEPLRLGVVRRKIGVGKRPGRRHPVGMADRREILLAQPQQYRAVHLGVAAHPIMNAGMEGTAVLVVPGLLGLVALLAEYRFGIPVLPLARKIAAALEDQDALAGRGEAIGEGVAAGAAAEDDHVIAVVAHWEPPRRAKSQRKMQRRVGEWGSLAPRGPPPKPRWPA